MNQFPKDVQDVIQTLAGDPDDKRYKVGKKLTARSPDLEAMWQSLEKRRTGSDDLWVWAFLGAATEAASTPKFYDLSGADRKKLAKKIDRQCELLAKLLKENQIDGHLVYWNGSIFDGFYLHEEFSEANRALIDKAGSKKLALSQFLKSTAQHCSERLLDEPERGKRGENAEAIRFIRVLAKRNELLDGTPGNKVLMASANAIFETSYSESDVAHLLNR